MIDDFLGVRSSHKSIQYFVALLIKRSGLVVTPYVHFKTNFSRPSLILKMVVFPDTATNPK